MKSSTFKSHSFSKTSLSDQSLYYHTLFQRSYFKIPTKSSSHYVKAHSLSLNPLPFQGSNMLLHAPPCTEKKSAAKHNLSHLT